MPVDLMFQWKDIGWLIGLKKKQKKEWNNAICSNMDGPRDYHTKWNKSDRERQISYDITYMWNIRLSLVNTFFIYLK